MKRDEIRNDQVLIHSRRRDWESNSYWLTKVRVVDVENRYASNRFNWNEPKISHSRHDRGVLVVSLDQTSGEEIKRFVAQPAELKGLWDELMPPIEAKLKRESEERLRQQEAYNKLQEERQETRQVLAALGVETDELHGVTRLGISHKTLRRLAEFARDHGWTA